VSNGLVKPVRNKKNPPNLFVGRSQEIDIRRITEGAKKIMLTVNGESAMMPGVFVDASYLIDKLNGHIPRDVAHRLLDYITCQMRYDYMDQRAHEPLGDYSKFTLDSLEPLVLLEYNNNDFHVNSFSILSADEVLERINDDRSDEWTPYDRTDWVIGAIEFMGEEKIHAVKYIPKSKWESVHNAVASVSIPKDEAVVMFNNIEENHLESSDTTYTEIPDGENDYMELTQSCEGTSATQSFGI